VAERAAELASSGVGAYLDLIRRNPDFRRAFAAELISLGGDWFAVIPLLSLLPVLTGTGLWGGLVLAVDTAMVALLAPYAGTVADRIDRRTILIVSNLASAGSVLLLLLVRSEATAWIALVAVGAVAMSKAFYTPASQAALPNLVDPEDLPVANVLAGGAWGTMLVIGASLGGVFAHWLGTDVCFLLDASCLLVAAALTWRVRRPFQASNHGEDHPGTLSAVRESLRYIRTSPSVAALITVKPGVGLGNGALTLFPLLATSVFTVGPLGAGLFYAARGLGALVGPVLLRGPLLKPGRLLPGLAISMATYGLAYLAFGVAPWFWLALLLCAVAHTGGGANWVLSNYALQAQVPDGLRGRVFSTDFMLATLAITCSQVFAGVLSDHVPLRILASAGGAVTLLYAVVWAFFTARIRLSERVERA
jgi:MFS family permease